jgi:hypothetical protein
MGIMNGPCDTLLVDACEIDHNGTAAYFGYSHNTYFGGNAVTVRACRIHDSLYGQNVKSRAHYTELLYNWIADSSDGEVGLVDAAETTAADSNAVMIGNIVVSKASRGSAFNSVRFVQFGQDSGGAHVGTLYAFANTFAAGNANIVFLDANHPQAAVQASGNVFVGSTKLWSGGSGSIAGTGNWAPDGAAIPSGITATPTGASPGFIDQIGRDFHLAPTSPCCDIGAAALSYRDGGGASHAGLPALEYVPHLQTVVRASDGYPDAGAYEYVGATTTGGSTMTGGTTTGSGSTTASGTSGGSTTGAPPDGGAPGGSGCGFGAGIACIAAVLAARRRR